MIDSQVAKMRLQLTKFGRPIMMPTWLFYKYFAKIRLERLSVPAKARDWLLMHHPTPYDSRGMVSRVDVMSRDAAANKLNAYVHSFQIHWFICVL
ncbi:hypothetical protein TNCV_4614671 [Trichonephila clavipes]|nr:hypothetical protein TNCV_4614671 [Trichonephila clavipes]